VEGNLVRIPTPSCCRSVLPFSADDLVTIDPVQAPFNAQSSVRHCAQAALNTARAFSQLPYPSLSPAPSDTPPFLSPTSSCPAPRLMPTYACCAMNAGYALLVLSLMRQLSLQSNSADRESVTALRQFRQGAKMIERALRNYSLAFEAIGGMQSECPVVRREAMSSGLYWLFQLK
jgi:hypothetical protein